MRDSPLIHTFAKDGRYAVRVADALDAGGPCDFHYRLNRGEPPYVTSVFPLGGARDGVTSFPSKASTSAPRGSGADVRASCRSTRTGRRRAQDSSRAGATPARDAVDSRHGAREDGAATDTLTFKLTTADGKRR